MKNTLTLDELQRGANLDFTASALPALGEGGSVTVYGNKLSGRIVVSVGTGSTGKTPCRINFPEDDCFGTDDLDIIIRSRDSNFFDVVPVAVEGNGFEIKSKELWDDCTVYEFTYMIISHMI